MEQASVAVLGVGDLRHGPPVLAALATYFGERPLEVVLYDPSPEILDAMHRLARAFFKVSDARHAIVSTTDLDEAIGLADRYVVCDAARPEPLPDLSELTMEASIPAPSSASALERDRTGGEILALPHGEWPPELTAAERAAMPLQILRWIRLEDWPWEPLLNQQAAPVKAFLDGRPLVV